MENDFELTDIQLLAECTITGCEEYEGFIYAGIDEDPEKFFVLNCLEDFQDWYRNEVAQPEEFSKDYDDDGTVQRILETETWQYLTPEYLSQYVRQRTGVYTVNYEGFKIDLAKLNMMLLAFDAFDKSDLPEDIRLEMLRVQYNCQTICRNVFKNTMKEHINKIKNGK